MNFEDIVGQEHVIQYFKNSIEMDKVGHAYAFDGPHGLGKKKAALAFSKSILCKVKSPLPCNKCSSCLKFDHMNHPDLHIIESEGNSIRNKQIEDFQHEIQLKPYESNKKIFIIENANDMTISAQNRLLKTLEEPPEYVTIILLSSNVNGFLPTIKSRCQIIKFNRVGEKIIETVLINKYNMSLDEARVMAAFSQGIIGNAIKLKDSKEFREDREAIIEIVEKLMEKDSLTPFKAFEFFNGKKDIIYDYLDIILFWFRDLLILKETNYEGLLINLDKRGTLQRHLNYISNEKISNIIDIIEKTKKDIKANVNFQLAIEMMLLRIQEV